MKKKLLYISFAFASMMSYAQQGKVGVNTADPKATVDITKNSANTTNDVEGLLIPRVSKEKAFKMAGNAAIKESTLLYVDESVYTFPATATDVQKATVEDITENGYYFWNGIKWVSVSGVEGSIWKYANNKVFVDRNTVTDNVEYLEEGGYRHFPRQMRTITSTNPVTDAFEERTLDTDAISAYRWNLTFSDLIKEQSLNDKYPYKTLSLNTLYVDENESSSIKNYYSSWLSVQDNQNTTRDIGALYGLVSSSNHFGKGDVKRMIGTYGYTTQNSPNVTVGAVHGAYNQTTISPTATGSTVSELSGTRNVVYVRGDATVGNMSGASNYLRVYPDVSSDITNVMMTRNYLNVDQASGQIDKVFGSYTSVEYGTDNATPINIDHMYGTYIAGMTKGQQANYGIYLQNVGNTTATKNYAIYTNAGKVYHKDYLGLGIETPQAQLDVNGSSIFRTTTDKVSYFLSSPLVGGDGGMIHSQGLASAYRGFKEYTMGTGSDGASYRIGAISDVTQVNGVDKDLLVVKYTGNIGVGTSTPTEKLEVAGKIKAANVIFTGIAEYADNAAAIAGGLVVGEMYRTADGTVKIVF